MQQQVCLYRIGDEWRQVGPDGFSNETGGYPPGWCDKASPAELEAAWVVRVDLPDAPAGKIEVSRAFVDLEGGRPEVVLDLRDMTSDEVAALSSLRVEQVKAEAGRRILERYPTWKQANMNMRATELVDARVDRALTDDEEAERQDLLAASAWIKDVRAASDAIEAALPDDAEGLCAFIAATADGWPA